MGQSLTPWVAGNVRAELARQRRSARSVAAALGITPSSFQRRLSGQYPFNVDELAAVAAFLDVPLPQLLASPHEHATANSA